MRIPQAAHADIKFLYEHWRALAPEGGLPGRQHFDPMSVPHLLPNIWLIDVHREPLRFWRRLVGSRIEEFAGMSLSNGWVGEGLSSGPRLSGVRCLLADVVETRRPSWRRGKSLIRADKKLTELERIYLPLAGDGALVDMILAMTVFYEASMESLSGAPRDAALATPGMPGAMEEEALAV